MKLDPVTHPDESTTAAYLDGTLAGTDVERVERHLARCSRCRGTIVALRGTPIEEEPVPPELLERAQAQAGTRSRRGLWIGAGAAAAAAIVVALVGGLREHTPVPAPPEEPRYRAPVEGLAALSPAAGAVVTGPELLLRWSALENAERYVVTVTAPDATPVATLDTEGTTTEVSWRVPENLRRPATLFWSVRALRGGRTLEESRPHAFEVR